MHYFERATGSRSKVSQNKTRFLFDLCPSFKTCFCFVKCNRKNCDAKNEPLQHDTKLA